MKQKIIFVHVPKCAGTSFMRVVHANHLNVYDFIGFRDFFTTDLSVIDFIRGHVPYGIGIFRNINPTYITFLRNPVERCISYFYFIQEWYKHPSYKDAFNNSISEIYSITKYQNMQTKYIGGFCVPFANIFIPSNNIINIAKRRLRDKFIYGIVEYYSESVEHICSELGWNEKPIVNVRGAKLRKRNEDISSEELVKVRKLNSLDCELYEYACGQFQRRTRI